MTGTVLERSLYAVIGRLQKLRILRRQTTCWLMLLGPAILVTLWLPRRIGILGPEVLVVLGATLIGVFLARVLVRNPSKTEAARLIEQADPDVNDAIITAVQIADRTGHRPSVLAATVIQEADQLARQRDWSGAVPARQIMKWTVLSFLSFVLMVSSVMAASRYGRDLLQSPDSDKTTAEENKVVSPPMTELVIEPGNTEIELGTALTVVARFPGTVPVHAALEFMDSNQLNRTMSMTETVDAGVFAARMEEITSDGTYRVLYDESESQSDSPAMSPTFSVKTYVRPRLDHVDATITPPAWAGRPQELIEDVMRMTVTEGSTVKLRLYLNKPVIVAELRSADEIKVPLTQDPQDLTVVETTMVVSESNAWTVFLQDAEGRIPAEEEKVSIKVTFNQPAKVKAVFPGRDTNVSPLQEFLVEANASDDFALVDFGVQYSVSGGELKEISAKPPLRSHNPDTAPATAELPAPADLPAPALLNTAILHDIDLESLNAAPDDLVTYSFWATDIAADGSDRRSYSDIMFAEVRRFEEIFRESQQGEQPQQQQQQQQQGQQQGSAVDGVLKLQKEIISATWNVIRTEAVSRRNGTYTQDVETITESQGTASEQLQEAIEKLQGEPRTTALAQRALEEMTATKTKLEDIRDNVEGARLADAMPMEQTIVQTLLKMRAAEFQVQQQQQQQQGGGGGGGGSSSSQQQMQQLELDNERNRYESEQQAQQQQEMTEQQRNQLQVLNRLKELARRQQMVNERLKQLESELRAATTEKEREEIQRELKRLREEQREMLRDVEELGEKMEQSSNTQNPQASEMKQRMQQARENVQQASRAMDEGRLSEAIAEGTRAERQFEELKEEFRNQTSSQFDEAVRDLRDQARELSDEQQKLAQQLTGELPVPEKSKQPSLKSERNRDQLQKDFGQQKDRLNRVVEQAKQMIEQAEVSEPLLSNKLYDTLRELKDSKPEEALEATEFLAGRGMWGQSQEAEQAARKGIDQLRLGIEKAADSVLGSEAESLRRAQSQLDDATKKLASEVQSATGEVPAQSRRPGQRGEQEQAGEQGQDVKNSADENNRPPGSDNGSDESGKGDKRRPGQPGQPDDKAQTDKGQADKAQADKGQADKGQADKAQAGKAQTAEEDAKASGDGGTQPSGERQPGQPGEQGQPNEGGNENNTAQQDGKTSTTQTSDQSKSDQKGQKGANGQSRGDSQPQSGQRRTSSLLDGGRESNAGGGANNSADRPLTGDDFGEWSDQLRDIEEMLEDPELRNRVAKVRDRARAIREEFKRHGEMPQWDLVKSQLLGEMQSLQQRINQEVSKLESDRAMVPIDREPVPEEFDALVQRYYELLGQERDNSERPDQKNSPGK